MSRDIRFAWRSIWKTKAQTLVAVTTLGLAMGATTSVFGLIDGVVLRKLTSPEPHRLVSVSMVDHHGDRLNVSGPMILEMEARQRVLSGLVGWVGDLVLNVETTGNLGLSNVWAVSGNFYSTLGERPILGRLLTSDDSRLETGAGLPVVVLGYGFWQRRFDGDPGVLNQQIYIEGQTFTIVGVTREWFTGFKTGVAPDVTIPITTLPHVARATGLEVHLDDATWLGLEVAGRLLPGIGVEQASEHFHSFWRDVLDRTVPASYDSEARRMYRTLAVRVESAARGAGMEGRAPFVLPLYVLMGLGCVMLMMACLHVAALMFSQMFRRTHEIALCLALGSPRWRLVRRVLITCLIVSALGTALGVPLAAVSSRILVSVMLERAVVPVLIDLRPNLYVVGFAAAMGCAAAILCSVACWWLVVRQDPARVIQLSTPSMRRVGWLLPGILVGSQMALSMALLVTAVVMIRSLQDWQFSPGSARNENVLIARLYPRPAGYANIDDGRYYRELIENIEAHPGVGSAALANQEPGGAFQYEESVAAVGYDGLGVRATYAVVSPRFFESLGLRLVAGRDFTWSDDGNRRRVAVVSRNLAGRLFPETEAVGGLLRVGLDGERPDVEVVGIVNTARVFDVRKPSPFIVYVPWLQEPEFVHWAGQMIVRTVGGGHRVPAMIRETLEKLGHEYALWIATSGEITRRALANERVATGMAVFFAGLATLLSMIGLFASVSHSVVEQTREIGIRMAIGSSRREVISNVVLRALRISAVGVGIGIPLAVVAVEFLTALLVGIVDDSLGIIAGVGGTMVLIVCLAACPPALRAAAVRPSDSLRF